MDPIVVLTTAMADLNATSTDSMDPMADLTAASANPTDPTAAMIAPTTSLL